MQSGGNPYDVPVVGGSVALQKRIRDALARYPAWYVRSARVSQFEVSDLPEVKEQIACYQHGSRKVYVASSVGDILGKAIGHELAHACDDNFGAPHFFTSRVDWARIHRNQSYFDIPKYAEEGLEYFADMVVKYFMLGPQKLSTTNPDEVVYIENVFATLQREFGT